MKLPKFVTLTAIIIIAVTNLLIAYDIAIVLIAPEATLSNIIKWWSYIYGISFIPAFYGILGGHFFFPSNIPRAVWKYILMAGIFILVGTVGTICYNVFPHSWAQYVFHPYPIQLVFQPVGFLLWPQAKERGF